MDRLHQQFKIITETLDRRTRVRVQTPVNIQPSDLGALGFLREVDVDDVVADLRSKPIENAAHVPEPYMADLPTFMQWAGNLQTQGQRYFHGVSKNCRNCQYRASPTAPLKSGVHDCWSDALAQGLLHGSGNLQDRNNPLSIDLWGGASGARSLADTVLLQGRAFLPDIQLEDLTSKAVYKGQGMSPLERRMAQINAFLPGGPEFVLDESRLSDMDDWEWPLHMIDFETTAPAIPFFKDMRPYETLAFQFSHHIMEKVEGGLVRIRHASQWISTQAECFPSIEFVRQLRTALMPSGSLQGTVFRYHNHENTVLRSLRKTILDAGSSLIPDALELIAFIDLITKSTGDEIKETGEYIGPKPMVDLHKLVQEGYYSKKAGGSISLKYMLPAILNDAKGLSVMYSKPGVYGVGLPVQSLNFDEPNGHIWLDPGKAGDPYKTLPNIFGSDHGPLNQMLQRIAGDDDEDGTSINQGGLAMTAYNYTQFKCLSATERSSIEHALLRYCELDTFAMVMLVQGLMELRGKPLNVIH